MLPWVIRSKTIGMHGAKIGVTMLTVCLGHCPVHAQACCSAAQVLQAGAAPDPAHWLGRQRSHTPVSAGICASSTAACMDGAANSAQTINVPPELQRLRTQSSTWSVRDVFVAYAVKLSAPCTIVWTRYGIALDSALWTGMPSKQEGIWTLIGCTWQCPL